MSEYQRYEFMTVDRPLTGEELSKVNDLSSHIEASATHALIEYNWGDFKHNSIRVLHEFFDGFLYWANWGAPRLAFRFPHGVLPANLLDDYDLDDLVAFTSHPKYDILDIHFGEMEAPDEWEDYDLGSLIAIRDELMEGDQRALYICWLASQQMYGDDDDFDEDGEDEEDDDGSFPAIPPGFEALTSAQQALARLLQVPSELLIAAARHSRAIKASPDDDIAAWIKRLSPERRDDYLLRLAHNEPGLHRLLLTELRELGRGKAQSTEPPGERVRFATLLAESQRISARWEQEKREQEQLARQRRLEYVHEQQEKYWRDVYQAAERKSSSGYDEATRLLVELREAAEHFHEAGAFQARFAIFAQQLPRRPALIERLRKQRFPV